MLAKKRKEKRPKQQIAVVKWRQFYASKEGNEAEEVTLL